MDTNTADTDRRIEREPNTTDTCPYCGTTIATQESLGIHVTKCPEVCR